MTEAIVTGLMQRIERTPHRWPPGHGRRAITLIDVLVAVSLLLLLFLSWHMFVRRPPHDSAIRTVCMSNLRQMAVGACSYAATYKDQFPLFPFAGPVQRETGGVTYAPYRIGKYRERYSTTDDTDLSTTRSLWILFQQSGLGRQAEVFICPGTEEVPTARGEDRTYFDFASYANISYGYQVPFGQKGRPSAKLKRPGELAFAADQGPYSASLEDGLSHPGPPTAASSGSARDWRPWSSPNHDGLWNNVAFMDGHVESGRTPLVGANDDNIYTRWEDVNAGQGVANPKRIHGVPPTSNETPLDDADTSIYP